MSLEVIENAYQINGIFNQKKMTDNLTPALGITEWFLLENTKNYATHSAKCID